jgi:hypothetical protein
MPFNSKFTSAIEGVLRLHVIFAYAKITFRSG